MKVGDMRQTFGGWEVEVIWICRNDLLNGFYAIHKPYSEDESVPIYHQSNGTAHSILGINEPPRYDSKNPADILI